MLSSRYLHLHEALGLGPMWLKQEATLLPSHNHIEDTKPSLPNITSPMPGHPSKPFATAQITTTTASPTLDKGAPTSNAHAATLASIGIKRQTPQTAITPSHPAPSPEQSQPADNTDTVPHIKQTRSRQIKPAKLMVISICPSPEDSVAGQLFCGQVGELLNNMLSSIGLTAAESHLTSWLDATEFDPNPDSTKLTQALPRIRAELELAEPAAILFLGQFFTAPEQAPIMEKLCGKRPVFHTDHPARLLRHPQQKAEAWAALKKLRTVLQTAPANKL